MGDNMNGLCESWKKRKDEARDLAMKAIDELSISGKPVNFSSVAKLSGISRTFLYETADIRERIEIQRGCETAKRMNQRANYDKTAKSKDVVIESKERRIAKLEKENARLKAEVEHLRGLIYEGH